MSKRAAGGWVGRWGWDQSHLIPLSSHQAPKNYFAENYDENYDENCDEKNNENYDVNYDEKSGHDGHYGHYGQYGHYGLYGHYGYFGTVTNMSLKDYNEAKAKFSLLKAFLNY